MVKTKKKESEGLDLIENPDAIVSKTEEFFNNKKNQNLVFGIGGFLAVIVLAYLGYSYYINSRNTEAQEEMFQAVYYFEMDSLGLALNGDGNSYGFLDILDYYSGTKAANLSSFYTGMIYMRLQDYENAIRYLEDFSSGDLLIQARAYSLMGDAYMELDDFESAANNYKRAAGYKPNKEFSPMYLNKLALAYEMQGKYADAAETYGTIIDEYFDSPYTQEAQKHKARMEGLSAD